MAEQNSEEKKEESRIHISDVSSIDVNDYSHPGVSRPTSFPKKGQVEGSESRIHISSVSSIDVNDYSHPDVSRPTNFPKNAKVPVPSMEESKEVPMRVTVP